MCSNKKKLSCLSKLNCFTSKFRTLFNTFAACNFHKETATCELCAVEHFEKRIPEILPRLHVQMQLLVLLDPSFASGIFSESENAFRNK